MTHNTDGVPPLCVYMFWIPAYSKRGQVCQAPTLLLFVYKRGGFQESRHSGPSRSFHTGQTKNTGSVYLTSQTRNESLFYSVLQPELSCQFIMVQMNQINQCDIFSHLLFITITPQFLVSLLWGTDGRCCMCTSHPHQDGTHLSIFACLHSIITFFKTGSLWNWSALYPDCFSLLCFAAVVVVDLSLCKQKAHLQA